MNLLRACDDLKGFIETAQKLIEIWDEDPDNYSKLEQHLTELKAEIEKFKDWSDCQLVVVVPSHLHRSDHL